jgi:FdhD protein
VTAPDPRPAPLASEQAVELEVNGTRFATLMCTPRDLDVLALGHLLTCGIIARLDDVAGVSIGPDGSRVAVRCAPRPAGPADRPLPRAEPFPMESLRAWAAEMFERAVMHRETGGMHCAALANRAGLLCFYEDVGRHNAIDKAIGGGLVDRVDFAGCCIISSGRIACEMATKVIAAGIPLFVSHHIPTTAARELAARKGLAMIGRIGTPSPVVY